MMGVMVVMLLLRCGMVVMVGLRSRRSVVVMMILLPQMGVRMGMGVGRVMLPAADRSVFFIMAVVMMMFHCPLLLPKLLTPGDHAISFYLIPNRVGYIIAPISRAAFTISG